MANDHTHTHTQTATRERIDEEYSCPNCDHDGPFSSPTFRKRRCTRCGHRGDATTFRTSPQAECPDCGATAPKTHEQGATSVFTCRSCYTQFER